MIRITIDLLVLTLVALMAWIIISGGQVIDIGAVTLGLRNVQNPTILLLILLTMRLLVFPTSLMNRPRKFIIFAAFRSLCFLVLSILAVKLFVCVLDQYHFHRALRPLDWLTTYAIDLSLVFGLVLMLLLLVAVCQIPKKLHLSKAVEQPPHRLPYVALTLLIWLSTATAGLYILLGYTYFEWGSFIEPHHVQAIHMAGVGPEFKSLFFRWHTLVAVMVSVILFLLSKKIEQRL